MEMKINLDDLFGQSKTIKVVKQQQQHKKTAVKTQHELQDSFESSFRHSDYKLNIDVNTHLFGSDSEHDQINSNSQGSNPTQISKQYTFKSRNSHKQIRPGERLYYEHKANQIRKTKQFERIKNQQISKQLEQIKKKPTINQYSIKILEKKNREKQFQHQQKNLYGTSENLNYTQFSKNRKQNHKLKLQEQHKTTFMRKEQQQLRNCTFKPALIAKGSNFVKQRPKQKVFDYLFEQQKLKEYRKKMITEEQQIQLTKNSKKMTKAQLNQFIQRNDKFQQKVNKKQKIVKNTVKTHDLNSGMKLFSPRINTQEPNQKYLTSFTSPKRIKQNVEKSFSTKPRQSSKIAQQAAISQFHSQHSLLPQSLEETQQKTQLKDINHSVQVRQQVRDQLFQLSNRLKKIQFPKQIPKNHTISQYVNQLYGEQANQDE